MKKKLQKQDIDDLLRGSSLYSTGGGVEFHIQKKRILKLLEEGKSLALISIDELKDTDDVFTTYIVGSTTQTGVDLALAIKKGIFILEKETRKSFSAIFAGEINIESLAFQSAALLSLPVLDADCCGGRAVPQVQMDNVVILGKNTTPLVAVNQTGEVRVLKKAISGEKLEQFTRNFSIESNSGIAVLDHPISIKTARETLELGTLSRSLATGKFMRIYKNNNDYLTKLAVYMGAHLVINGRVARIDFDKTASIGFLLGRYSISDSFRNVVEIFVQNENIICWKNNKVLVTGPELIMALDLKTNIGIHNSALYEGQELAVFVKSASNHWHSQAGLACFDPKKFGLQLTTTLVNDAIKRRLL